MRGDSTSWGQLRLFQTVAYRAGSVNAGTSFLPAGRAIPWNSADRIVLLACLRAGGYIYEYRIQD